MSEFDTLADLFPADRQPTRPFEPIQKVDRTVEIDRDIDEFYETPSAKRVVQETAAIVANDGIDHRFRYVHATFGSGKSHLLKLIGVATGELEGLDAQAHRLANQTTGFKEFRDTLAESHIDHLQPLFMNLLDRDRDDSQLPLMLYEELGRHQGYYTTYPWLLEFCWQLDIQYGIWEDVAEHEYEGLQLADVIDRPASLQPWLKTAIPQVEGAAQAGLGSAAAVEEAIADADDAIDTENFGPDALVERLAQTKRHLQRDGDIYEFLIGLDEIAIYVGDQPERYEEVVDTIEALIDGLNPPILGTGQWPMRDMQQNFIGDVDESAWYAQEIELEGADTETIVRKRWLQKSDDGGDYISEQLLAEAPSLEPTVAAEADPVDHDNPVEAYPFRDRDLWLLRAAMQGLIEGDRDTDREYIQGRALLVRVRSLFADHGWADKAPGAVVSWDLLYDIIAADTALVPSWASELIGRVENTLEDELATRTAKALFLLSQVDSVPRTPENLARLLARDVTVDLASLTEDVEQRLAELADRNLIREDIEATPTTYTILSEEDIQFWQEVQQEATEMPDHQVRDNIQTYIQEAAPDVLSSPETTATGDFASVADIRYQVRYTVDRSIPDSVTDEYDTVVIRVLANDQETVNTQRDSWQDRNSGPSGREDVLITIELTQALRRQVRQLVGMQTVLSTMADPQPQYRLDRQETEETVENEIRDRLQTGQVYLPNRETAYGSYLDALDEAVSDAVEEKFPNRKYIEQPLQLDDLDALIQFFEGDGSWPFTEADADCLGVQIVPRKIGDGWVTEFLTAETFRDEDRVSGERVLDTIRSRRGAFLGTPLESLQALLFVLVADNRIAVRENGERVTDTGTIARIITRSSRLEDAILEFDPEPPAEDLTDVYATVVGTPPETDDTQTLVEELTQWADEHTSLIKTVVSRTTLEFDGHITLEDLEAALEPAFSRDDLDPDYLTNSTVVEQAELFATAAPLFRSEDGEDPLWDQFEEMRAFLVEHYPTADITKEMAATASGSQIPSKETLEDQLERATTYRIEELQTLYHRLTDQEADVDDLGQLRSALTAALTDDDLSAEIDTVTSTYSEVRLEALQSLIGEAESTTDPLPESAFAAQAIREDATTLANGRVLLGTDHDGDSLHAQLRELAEELTESHSGFVVTKIQQAVSGTDIPDADRAQQLLRQGRSILAGDQPDDDDGDDALQQLWEKVAAHEDGTIVIIDTEEQR